MNIQLNLWYKWPNDIKTTLVQVMAWHLAGDASLQARKQVLKTLNILFYTVRLIVIMTIHVNVARIWSIQT